MNIQTFFKKAYEYSDIFQKQLMNIQVFFRKLLIYIQIFFIMI